MANILETENLILLLIKFLKIIKIRVKEGARERKIEWEQKNDQIKEDLICTYLPKI